MKIGWDHVILFIIFFCLPIGACIATGGYAHLFSPILFLFLPCRDQQFGNGRKYYWVRQTMLVSCAIIVIILNLTGWYIKST